MIYEEAERYSKLLFSEDNEALTQLEKELQVDLSSMSAKALIDALRLHTGWDPAIAVNCCAGCSGWGDCREHYFDHPMDTHFVDHSIDGQLDMVMRTFITDAKGIRSLEDCSVEEIREQATEYREKAEHYQKIAERFDEIAAKAPAYFEEQQRLAAEESLQQEKREREFGPLAIEALNEVLRSHGGSIDRKHIPVALIKIDKWVNHENRPEILQCLRSDSFLNTHLKLDGDTGVVSYKRNLPPARGRRGSPPAPPRPRRNLPRIDSLTSCTKLGKKLLREGRAECDPSTKPINPTS